MSRPPKKDYLLRVIGASKGWTRKEVAEKCDTTESNIWRAEVGLILSEEVAKRIAEIMDINSDLMFYNMGRIPPEKMDFIKKDPLFFKELIDEACAEPWRLSKTQEYVKALKGKMNTINPDINKLLSKIKPSK